MSSAARHSRSEFVLHAAYLLPWKDAVVPALHAHGVRTHCLHVRSPLDPRWLLRLGQLVRQERYDIVHIHSPVVAGLSRPLLRLIPTPWRRPALVYTEHNRWTGYKRGTRFMNSLTYPLDDAHLAVSEDTKATISHRFRSDVEVSVQGILLDRITPLRSQRNEVRAELGLTGDDVAVVTVANLRVQKAYPDLLRAARIVLATDPDVVWLAIGQGPLETELKQMAQTLGLGDRFRFLGHRPDAVRVVAGCDLFALASRYEGYPVAVMEALALGLPVVATSVGGVPLAVDDGVSGLIVPPGRPDLLAQAVLRVTTDTTLRARLAAGALIRGQSYEIGSTVRSNETLYRRLAAQRARRVDDHGRSRIGRLRSR